MPSNETPFKSPAKRHLNGISLVDQWWLNIKNAGLEVLRFSIHFVRVAFTSTKDTASPYTFKRIFASMPIHLLALFLSFIMSNFFYKGGGRVPTCLFQNKLREIIWDGSFFPGGGVLGVHLLIPFFLFFAYFYYVQKMHNTSAATFDIKVLFISLK